MLKLDLTEYGFLNRYADLIDTIDSHTQGEPTRLLISGVGSLPGSTMKDKRDYFESHMDRSACGTGLGLAIGFHLFYKPTVKFAGNSVSCEGLSLMKITRCIYWTEDLKLSRPYTIAYTTVNSVENIFVQLELEEGSALKIMRRVQ